MCFSMALFYTFFFSVENELSCVGKAIALKRVHWKIKIELVLAFLINFITELILSETVITAGGTQLDTMSVRYRYFFCFYG